MLAAAVWTSRTASPSNFDASVDSFVWAADNKSLFFTAEEKAGTAIFTVALKDHKVRKFLDGGTNNSISLDKEGTMLAFSREALDRPAEVFVTRLDGKPAAKDLSHTNAKLVAELDLPRSESVTVKVENADMQMWILKPPGFDPKKKWPLVYLVHGGPQGAWADEWHYRWNPQVWAAQGYVVALPNPRGSTGFGQKYVDEISGDWGGKCYDDLMAGVAYLEKQPYIDTGPHGRSRGVLRRLHDELVSGPHHQIQDAHHPLRRLQFRQHVRLDG